MSYFIYEYAKKSTSSTIFYPMTVVSRIANNFEFDRSSTILTVTNNYDQNIDFQYINPAFHKHNNLEFNDNIES